MERKFKTRVFIIDVPVAGYDLKPFKVKIPSEFLHVHGILITHSHYNSGFTKNSILPVAANVSLSFNNKSSNPVNVSVEDNPKLNVSTRKLSWLKLDEETFPGEFIEGYVENLLAADYYFKIYLRGKVEFK